MYCGPEQWHYLVEGIPRFGVWEPELGSELCKCLSNHFISLRLFPCPKWGKQRCLTAALLWGSKLLVRSARACSWGIRNFGISQSWVDFGQTMHCCKPQFPYVQNAEIIICLHSVVVEVKWDDICHTCCIDIILVFGKLYHIVQMHIILSLFLLCEHGNLEIWRISWCTCMSETLWYNVTSQIPTKWKQHSTVECNFLSSKLNQATSLL